MGEINTFKYNLFGFKNEKNGIKLNLWVNIAKICFTLPYPPCLRCPALPSLPCPVLSWKPHLFLIIFYLMMLNFTQIMTLLWVGETFEFEAKNDPKVLIFFTLKRTHRKKWEHFYIVKLQSLLVFQLHGRNNYL